APSEHPRPRGGRTRSPPRRGPPGAGRAAGTVHDLQDRRAGRPPLPRPHSGRAGAGGDRRPRAGDPVLPAGAGRQHPHRRPGVPRAGDQERGGARGVPGRPPRQGGRRGQGVPRPHPGHGCARAGRAPPLRGDPQHGGRGGVAEPPLPVPRAGAGAYGVHRGGGGRGHAAHPGGRGQGGGPRLLQVRLRLQHPARPPGRGAGRHLQPGAGPARAAPRRDPREPDVARRPPPGPVALPQRRLRFPEDRRSGRGAADRPVRPQGARAGRGADLPQARQHHGEPGRRHRRRRARPHRPGAEHGQARAGLRAEDGDRDDRRVL
ncbi:MAG: UDP-N-acetylenolpyruvoylglucosamine reductase, partial [uncultured Gemmatimonadetes bacterium]